MKFTYQILLLWISFVVAKHGEGGDPDTSVVPPPSPTPPSTSVVDSQTVASSTPPLSISSSATPSPSPSPILQLATPENATTCQNSTFSWLFSGAPDVPLTITVTNERVSQSPAVPSQNVPLVSRILSTNASSTDQKLVWHPVDVSQGWYAVVAFDTSHAFGLSGQSSPFFVQNGPDMSCLASTPLQTPSNTTSSDTPAPTTSDSSAGSKHLSTGDLVGTVAGVIVGVIIIVAAFTIPRLWRRALPPRSRARRPGGPYYLF